MKKELLVAEIKKNFNLKDEKNVGNIAKFVIGLSVKSNENKYEGCLGKIGLTANSLGCLIVELKNEVGLKCNCSSNCISWYINKMKTGKAKLVESVEEKRERLIKELAGVNKILKVK